MAHTEHEHILIIRFSALGDVAMTIPVIYSIATQYPKVKFTVATRPFFTRLFINAPSNVAVLPLDLKKQYSGLTGLLRMLKKLSSVKPTCVADLHNVLRSWIIDIFFRMRGARVAMVDKSRNKRNNLLSGGQEHENFVTRYTQVFSRLGYPVNLTFKSLFETQPANCSMEIKHPAVGIAPFARYFNKIYPTDLMRQVIAKLTAEGYNMYLFGARGHEADIIGKELADIHGCTNLAGAYSITDELAIMSKLDVMVSMDSANQHLASLCGTKVISIWGSTTPECGFLGYGQTPDSAVCLGAECQPCTIAGAPTCPLGHFKCMKGLSPDTIFSRIKQAITDNADN